jgi:enoyl-CoA hydratase/carnithine racemase
MGACAILPRIIGQGRASELLFLGRTMHGDEAERWGFYNALALPETLLTDATTLARTLAHGPTAAHAMTKRCLHDEWDMPIDAAIDHEARVQAACMCTDDFERAYRAFVDKRPPLFEGN